MITIETDGGIEPLDVLKVCGQDFTKIGLNVHGNDIDEAFSNQLVQIYQGGKDYLSETCQKCELMTICGGGYMPHRYSQRNGFANPSVYCGDLYKLITHIRDRVKAMLSY